jgi:hypothetical protein
LLAIAESASELAVRPERGIEKAGIIVLLVLVESRPRNRSCRRNCCRN